MTKRSVPMFEAEAVHPHDLQACLVDVLTGAPLWTVMPRISKCADIIRAGGGTGDIVARFTRSSPALRRYAEAGLLAGLLDDDLRGARPGALTAAYVWQNRDRGSGLKGETSASPRPSKRTSPRARTRR